MHTSLLSRATIYDRPPAPIVVALLLFALLQARSATLSDPEVDNYNVRVGTQTFAGLYQFTTNSLLCHWEGDWYLLPNYNAMTNPAPAAIAGMIDWLNNRQQAIDDAKRDTVHDGVDVFGYAEVNRVVDVMSGNPG